MTKAYAIAWMLLILPVISIADIAIIANKNIGIDSLSVDEAERLFLGKTKTLENSERPLLYDLPDNHQLKKQFYLKLTNKTPSQLNSYRARKMFSGQANFMPIALSSLAEVLMLVESTSNSIGYIPADEASRSVKILLIIPTQKEISR